MLNITNQPHIQTALIKSQMIKKRIVNGRGKCIQHPYVCSLNGDYTLSRIFELMLSCLYPHETTAFP